MDRWQTILAKTLDYCFHLPTLLIFALAGMAVIWLAYDLGVELGNGFIRVISNQGNINLYWANGCCQLIW